MTFPLNPNSAERHLHESDLPQVDLASREFGGSVIVASDEFFAEKENLIKPEPAESWKHMKGNRGGVYDGWETRRRWGRKQGDDWVIVRLGLPGILREIVVDTAFFKGNYPESISVEACALDPHAWVNEVTSEELEWVEIVPKSKCNGDCENQYQVSCGEQRFTHVRLNIHPDGGVARFRVYGHVVPDPRYLEGLSLDLAALENGGLVIEQNDKFFRPADNLIASDKGWETKRRRTEGNDWFVVKLGAAGYIKQVWIDTTRFIGNAPEAISIQAMNASADDWVQSEEWRELMPLTSVQPDTRHRFIVEDALQVTHVRLNIYPDGGLKRINLVGYLSEEGKSSMALRWFNLSTEPHLIKVLAQLGVPESIGARLVSLRPFQNMTEASAAAEQLSRYTSSSAVKAVRKLLFLEPADH